MKLTPLDIRHKEFKRGMRGYVDSEVDEFLDEIADEFERLFKENIDLAEQIDSLQEKVDQYKNLEDTLHKTLISAQKSAEELKANAEKEAQLILREAEMKARSMVNDSYADKQAVEKQIVMLKGAQEDFRFKFRSLLEGYLKTVEGLDAGARREIDEAAARAAASAKQEAATRETVVARPPGPSQGAESVSRPPQQDPAAHERPPAEPDRFASPPDHLASPGGKPPSALPRDGAEGGGSADDRSPAAGGLLDQAELHAAPGSTTSAERNGAPLLGKDDDLLSDVETEVGDNEFDW